MTDNPQDRASALERGAAELARRVRHGRETVEGAVQDELTGPMSRRRMHEGIDLALAALRDGGEPSAVLLIDIGNSEPESLAIAAEIMAAALRPDDLVGHYGDDVFVIVARDVADEDSAHKVAARLTRMLVGPLGGGDAGERIKIGLSVVRAEDPSAGAVVARADAAMYSARNRAGRSRRSDAEQYAARNKASREAHAGEGRLAPDAGRDALVEAAFDCSSIEDFDVYYQPIADLGCGSVAAVEAILHWEHPDLGTIEPSEFLPIAERRGQAVTLGRRVIEKACAQTVRWAATREGRPMRTSVRVSPSQVADPAFLEDLETALVDSGATGQQLALHLTEQTLADISPELAEALAYARVALVLDHCAAHAPSAQSVASLPIAVIKLDASAAQGGAAPDLRGAAELARSLDLPTVVDGIATRDGLRTLLGYGFPFGQGELFSRPQSAAAIEALVHRERPFASLLAPSRSMAATLAFDRDEPLIEVGAPAVP
jgi:diguanylate cyclase (GGDEF)-like protein